MVSLKCHKAMEETKEGTIIHLKVKISKRARFPAGYDEWKNRIIIEVDEEPVKGKANRKILEILSSLFNLKTNEICIAYGERQKEKGILVKKKKEELIKAIENEFE